jgi:ADP-heptose:LPS heptosyltransferase
LRRKNIDLAVLLNPSKEFNLFTNLAGIPIRVGYARKWGFLLNHKIKDKKYLGERHEVEYNLELVDLVGAITEDKTLSLRIDNDALEGLDLKIEKYDSLVALHPWTSDPMKQWPLSSFQELTKRLIKELGIKMVIIGGREELNKSIEIFQNFDNHLLNITGKTTLKQLAALLKNCRLLISGDSGPVHLACAVGTPVVAIFRNDIPAKSAKRWGPWGEDNMVIEKERLSDITVEEVFNKVRRGLNK